jgi:hypothetical protein
MTSQTERPKNFVANFFAPQPVTIRAAFDQVGDQVGDNKESSACDPSPAVSRALPRSAVERARPGAGWAVALACAGLFAQTAHGAEAATFEHRIQQVAQTPGLIAFWDFAKTGDETWAAHHDPRVMDRALPLYLKRIGDAQLYPPDRWPYEDADSALRFDASGPFGRAVQLNLGYLFAEVPRHTFEGTALDIQRRAPFTLMAWIQFTGQRHLVAGIWDEGGWDRYQGRRQIALFAGLFGQRGVIAHISATGAASYPQSQARGSQYARIRAIDPQPFENGQWVMLAMTFNPATHELTASLNGQARPLRLTDPVEQDVYGFAEPVSANPYWFRRPIYGPRTFVRQFNGYDAAGTGIHEHRVQVDLDQRTVAYERDMAAGWPITRRYRVTCDVRRGAASLLPQPLVFEAEHGHRAKLPGEQAFEIGDVVHLTLAAAADGGWEPVGTELRYTIPAGAPFTIGRALGLGSESLTHGSQLLVDGVAVFNRVLSPAEMQALTFVGSPSADTGGQKRR